MSKPILLRWLVVCLIPLATLLWFALNPPEDKTQHLINGIILALPAKPRSYSSSSSLMSSNTTSNKSLN